MTRVLQIGVNKLMKILFIFFTPILLTCCGYDCIDKKTGLHKSSNTISESKDHLVFKYEMLPVKNSFSLDNERKFKIKNAWVENSWCYECVDNKAIVKKDTYDQLVIDVTYNQKTSFSDYYVKQIGAGKSTALGSKLDFHYSGQDTFFILLASHHMLNKYADKPILDTIKFIKKIAH